MKMRGLYGLRNSFVQIALLSTACCLLFTLVGCESLARKFTRKPKEIKTEEPLIQPEVYPDVAVNREQLYKDYFLFWETWSDELIGSLDENANTKKQKESAFEALDNLLKLKNLLNEKRKNDLEPIVNDFQSVKDIVFAGRLSSSDFYYLRTKIERLKAKVHQGFIFSKIQKDLK